MSEQTAIQQAAGNMFSHMAEVSEDALENVWEARHPNFIEFLDHCTSEELEAWQEPIFREVMAELAAMCARRAEGKTP